jgi:putative colanic acid biosynthesis acetyltransferase WcaF
LRLFGAEVGNNVHIDSSAKIFIPWNLKIGDWTSVGFEVLLYNLGPLTIGERVTISQRAHLCGGSHDYRSSTMDLIKAPIRIGNGAWVCADAFIGPGVKVGRSAVVGARAVVVKDVADGVVVAGNPAGQVGKR